MILHYIWYFFIYAFLGWCTEVVYAAAKSGEFVNRGFLNGAYCPIYGFGVLFVVSVLEPVDNLFYLFAGAVLITSGIELVTGFVLEKAFHHKWWDYSDMPFNIGGYICLLFSMAWGLACLIVVDRIHPMVRSLVQSIPPAPGKVLLIGFACLFLIDFIASVRTILNLNRRLEIMDEITLKIRESSDLIGENLAHGTIALIQKKDEIEEGLEARREVVRIELAEMRQESQKVLAHRRQALKELRQARRELLEATPFGQKRLLKAFPGLRSLRHNDALESLKNRVAQAMTPSRDQAMNHEEEAAAE
ncbi:MAG: putative ABC transporter permease [Solirubrobacterales bacterium]